MNPKSKLIDALISLGINLGDFKINHSNYSNLQDSIEKAIVNNAWFNQEPISDEYYFIVPDKCTECKGFHDEPQCAAVCPVDCCVPDQDREESEEILIGKQRFMHPKD